jgi:methyl-accepting chemotaxis protein
MEIITKVRDTYGSIVNSIETTGFMITGFIDMINSRSREIDNIKNHVASVSEFSHDLSRSTGEQDENTATVSDTIRTVNEGAREFVEQSEKLSELSEELRKMALSLIEKQKQFKL